MKCPLCGKADDKVIESRQNQNGITIRRRRECLDCGYRFTSYEHIEEIPMVVIKQSGRREVFDRKKIERGILRAIAKRELNHQTIMDMIHDIENEAEMRSRSTHEIRSKTIGDIVLDRLFAIDKVAYIRFASIYKEFEDVGEFIQIIDNLGMRSEKEITLSGDL